VQIALSLESTGTQAAVRAGEVDALGIGAALGHPIRLVALINVQAGQTGARGPLVGHHIGRPRPVAQLLGVLLGRLGHQIRMRIVLQHKAGGTAALEATAHVHAFSTQTAWIVSGAFIDICRR